MKFNMEVSLHLGLFVHPQLLLACFLVCGTVSVAFVKQWTEWKLNTNAEEHPDSCNSWIITQ